MSRKGAVGALLDLYEQAISALKDVIADIPDGALTTITDPQTTDKHCKSVQGILAHVVSSGYGYATSITNLKGNNVKRPDLVYRFTVKEYLTDLTAVFAYTENIFTHIEDSELEQYTNALKIKTSWGQRYDIEQITEHAIVHIMRHRRQIENIKQKGFK